MNSGSGNAVSAGTSSLRIYTNSEMERELRQSEIISNLKQYVYNPASESVDIFVSDYCVILTQDCDLLQDFNRNEKGLESDLSGVIIYEAPLASALLSDISGSDIKKRIKQNKDERYHLLQGIGSDEDLQGAGIPPLIIDFKRCFTISPGEILRQIGAPDGAKRRCRLEAPYREHLQSRAAFYFARVGIPEPHQMIDGMKPLELPAPFVGTPGS